MPIIKRIDLLDRRSAQFCRSNFELVKARVGASAGRVTCAVHFGFSKELLFGEDSIMARDRVRSVLDMDLSAGGYERYVAETRRFLLHSGQPVFNFVDPQDNLPIVSGDDVDEAVIVQVRCPTPAEPRPFLESAEQSIWRTHWWAMRAVLQDLGVAEVDFVGEAFMRPYNRQGVKTYFCPGLLDFVWPQDDWRMQFCVDGAALHLCTFSFGAISGRFIFPFTFPGLIDTESRQRLTASNFAEYSGYGANN